MFFWEGLHQFNWLMRYSVVGVVYLAAGAADILSMRHMTAKRLVNATLTCT